jgi:hypothetical protein
VACSTLGRQLYSSNKYPPVPRDEKRWSTPRDTPLEYRYGGRQWKSVMEATNVWSERHPDIAEKLDKFTEQPLQFDLDPNAMTYMIVDDGGSGSFASLINALTRHLAVSLPSLAIKTGSTRKRPLGWKADQSTLEIAADAANSGTPTLFLDVRPVPHDAFASVSSRGELIEKAQQLYMARNSELRTVGMCDTLDACALAFFHEVLSGDGLFHTEELTGQASSDGKPMPLHRAITHKLKKLKQAQPTASDGTGTGTGTGAVEGAGVGVSRHDHFRQRAQVSPSGDVGHSLVDGIAHLMGTPRHRVEVEEEKWSDVVATPQQVAAVSDWLVEYTFQQAWDSLANRDELLAAGKTFDTEGRKAFQKEMLAMTTLARTLLSSKNFYHANITYPDAADRLVQQLVQLDRLPKENPLEGLLLLQSAWRDHDVATLLASRFKRGCKLGFMLQLLLGWVAIAFSTFFGSCNSDSYDSSDWSMHAIFAITVSATIITAVEAALNPHSRWRALRGGASRLESLIWRYRTRTGPFEIGASSSHRDPRSAEVELLREVQMTRLDILASANLATSEFAKRYSESVYRHFQDEGEPKPHRDVDKRDVILDTLALSDDLVDDHQTPCQPAKCAHARGNLHHPPRVAVLTDGLLDALACVRPAGILRCACSRRWPSTKSASHGTRAAPSRCTCWWSVWASAPPSSRTTR